MNFDTFVAIDWSGGADTGSTPRKDAIWAAIARREGGTEEPIYLRNRDLAQGWLADLLTAEIEAGQRCLIGFDFPFGCPTGLAAAVTGARDPKALWDWMADAFARAPADESRFDIAARINRSFPSKGPFWFNGLARDIPDLPRNKQDRDMDAMGLSETRLAETRAPGTFTCWQLGGAGAVGSQMMTGMAALADLRRRFGRALSVWPFDAADAPDAAVVVTEIWPSLLDVVVREALDQMADPIKDAAQVRVVAGALAEAQTAGTLAAMLRDVPDGAPRDEEGWILGIGHEAAFESAARAALFPDLQPPRLKNDCFAMPQGVDWTPVDTALDRLRDGLHAVVTSEEIAVGQGLGRVLSRDHLAQRSNPPGANTAVDGYGFAGAGVPPGRQVLPLIEGRAAAGAPFSGHVPPGKAIRILTGALLPDGVDTVVLEEDVTVGQGQIAFDGGLKPGANTRKAGEDVPAGAPVLAAGRVLTPADLALLSATGSATIAVHQRLRVGVLSTGDELVEPGSTDAPGRTYDANRPMLLAMAARWGYEPVDLGHVGDERAALAARFDQARDEADVLLTSGGASAGDEDHVAALLSQRGDMQTWRIALKPGRPLALALWNGLPVFGLPGNPVAAFVCTLIFARPALARLSGADWTLPQGYLLPAGFSKRKKAGRREYLRARLDADGRVAVFKSEGSGRISGLSWADGLVELPDAAATIAPGDPVRYLPFASFGL
ncbi:MAG: gephyrin-like molybdotransferase Glp [Pseudomonadota bacterium]